MAQREKGGRVVFIGNIPYGVSEEQICDIFGRVGTVLNFRLVYDKESGKPKGFGFLEYTNVDEAASATRNLNGYEIMGRQLKVDYSNDNGGGKNNQQQDQASNRAPPPAHFNMPPMGAPMPQSNGMDNSALPPLPPGVDVPAGLTAPDAISKTISAIPPSQLLDILSQMKGLAMSEPQKATKLLESAPQLSYAIFQALLLLGLVDTSVLTSLIQQTGPPQQPPPQQPPQMPPQYQQQPPPQQYAPPPQSYPPPQPYAPQPYPQHPGYAPTPPTYQQQPYQPPPQAQPPPQPQSQEAQIEAIKAMTREQIFALDEGTRDQVLQLRAALGAPVS